MPMAQPTATFVPGEGVRVVGGAATSGIAVAAAAEKMAKKKGKRGHGKRGKGRGVYKKRICPRCGKYKDKVANHGEGKCGPARE